MAKKGKDKGPPKVKEDHTFKALAGTVLIAIGCIAMFFLVDLLVPFRRPAHWRAIFSDYLLFQILLSMLITASSLFLVYIYLKDYFELKSKFTLGILFAVISFMLFGISSNPLLMRILGINPAAMGVFSIIPLIFAAISLGILVWISNK